MNEGSIERSGETVTLHYERHLAHPVEAVWRAITDPEEVAAWSGWEVEIDLRPGGRFVTRHQTGDRVVDRIVRVEPPHLLEHTFWEDVNPEARVTYRLDEEHGGCRLTLTHVLTMSDLRRSAERYSWAGDPTTQIPRTGAGWHRLLDRIAARLDGVASPAPADGLEERYAAKLV
ncbi:MAG TPA: SRPBCC family protein [Acidimicrobiales bacterium]|nr:SRPBCC family protein [Acidimicrobiales bacterium]